jgi:hypothetical protein
MVSKLHLAVLEAYQTAERLGEPQNIRDRLRMHFEHIGDGIGVHKSPQQYGAFSTDPYSHTPLHRGAQQPGMTGQVKEDILVQLGEMGLQVVDGNISFKPSLLSQKDFNSSPQAFTWVDLQRQKRTIELPAHSIAFTYCQVPVIYTLSNTNGITLMFDVGEPQGIAGNTLGEAWSKAIFHRTSGIQNIQVLIDRETVP